MSTTTVATLNRLHLNKVYGHSHFFYFEVSFLLCSFFNVIGSVGGLDFFFCFHQRKVSFAVNLRPCIIRMNGWASGTEGLQGKVYRSLQDQIR